ncbi:MAG: hypothetical protein NVV66_14435 [Cellulomonas sp.]|uniref:hypothetical protein n=1 Tax=Cellulomonas sp. TaxID=40001 RepID=UPI002586ACE3|nr:hypothetical protein [Cellulomonas sp.]MCR6705825.1 hypothetical protein [Cellulomonas sp.]
MRTVSEIRASRLEIEDGEIVKIDAKEDPCGEHCNARTGIGFQSMCQSRKKPALPAKLSQVHGDVVHSAEQPVRPSRYTTSRDQRLDPEVGPRRQVSRDAHEFPTNSSALTWRQQKCSRVVAN